jgi:hypothetical protein
MVFWDVVDWYRHLEETHASIFRAEDCSNSFLQSGGTCLPNCIVLRDLNTYMTLEPQIVALFSLVDYTVNVLCFTCSHLSKVKVIDMTGPQQRVLSGYHAIAGQQRPADEWELRKDKKFVNFALPELQHNLNLLMDMCEQVNTS